MIIASAGDGMSLLFLYFNQILTLLTNLIEEHS